MKFVLLALIAMATLAPGKSTGALSGGIVESEAIYSECFPECTSTQLQHMPDQCKKVCQDFQLSSEANAKCRIELGGGLMTMSATPTAANSGNGVVEYNEPKLVYGCPVYVEYNDMWFGAECSIEYITKYKCDCGYYGSPTGPDGGCTKCPSDGSLAGETDNQGSTDITKCVVSGSGSDETGSWAYARDCYYSK